MSRQKQTHHAMATAFHLCSSVSICGDTRFRNPSRRSSRLCGFAFFCSAICSDGAEKQSWRRRIAHESEVAFAAMDGGVLAGVGLSLLEMTPLVFTLVLFGISVAAGVLGSLVGLGGGIIVVPALTLWLHVDIRYAVGASIVSVIATSSGAAAAYVREHMTNLRVAMVLEIATTAGALSGALLAGVVGGRWLFVLFGLILGYSALAMFRNRHEDADRPLPPSRIAERLRLGGAYYDQAAGREIVYRVTRVPLGFGLMYVAGVVSGLLGIGSGSLKVAAMDLAMRLPIKVSTATSNFMIGVTAAASAGVYFARGDIDPFIAAPVAAGVLVGATAGSRLLGRLHGAVIRTVFIVVLIWISVQMLWKGARWP
ncbi:MAG: Arginine/ornithine antiporter ArcD [Phycisphaerales bacterium]|nr:Arginine/ornithine antiporter ArcD [Phycisphaerales bacterium]